MLLGLIAAGAGCMGGVHLRTELQVDAKRELFERQGKQAFCEVLASEAHQVEYVKKLRRTGTVISRSGPFVESSTVRCRFVANGVAREDDFDVPYDFQGMLAYAQRRFPDLGLGERRDEYEATEARLAASLLTVTYLPADPNRAVLGPLSARFPERNDSSDELAVFGGALVGALVLLGVARALRPPQPRPVDADGLA
ncbi:MAG: hypothetical protein SFW67_31780 [Myxococcaceae bacterium]|nr:hypothetical protein [Myxococcaceae bacterium]